MSKALPQQNKNGRLAAMLGFLVVVMIGLSFASVPLYRLFCQVTGFGGTTQQVEVSTGEVLNREMTISFNTDIDSDLPWDFKAEKPAIDIKVGESNLVFFDVTNNSDTTSYGTSVFNVTPHSVGEYFMKTECFCYEKQAVKAGETVKMPVSFFIDPDIMNDENLSDINNVTLSYTFYKSTD